MTPFAIGMPGTGELILILVIVMIVFGVGKLPKVMADLGKGVKAFKDGVNEGDKAMKEIDVTASTTEAEEVRSKTTT